MSEKDPANLSLYEAVYIIRKCKPSLNSFYFSILETMFKHF